MAKAALNFPFSNSLGDYSAYKMKGSDKIILRAKGGASKIKIKTDPAFERVRRNNAEFAGCSKAVSYIQRAFHGIRHLSDHNITGSLVKISKIIQKLDTENNHGERSILFSRHKNILGGLNFNNHPGFDAVVNLSPGFVFSRSAYRVSLLFPELFPGINLHCPANVTHYRFISVLGIIPDVVYSGDGYMQASEAIRYNPVSYMSDWYKTDAVSPEKVVEISLAGDSYLDDSGSLIVSVGIEFGRMVTNTLIEPVKHSGCAKVLGLG